jgi:hypothetical protein
VTDTAAAAAETPITKGEFARRRSVTPGRVSQWIKEKKIRPPAFDGEGRDARIFESIALGQLNRTLDIHQRLGNGAATNLSAPPAAPIDAEKKSDSAPAAVTGPGAGTTDNVIAFEARPPAPRPPAAVDEIGEQIRREQLETLQRRNRLERVKEAVDAGRLLDADQVEIANGKMARELIVAFDGALADLATAVASKFALPQRDVLHLLRAAWRDVRAKAATAATIEAEAMPEMIEFEISPAAGQVTATETAGAD